MLHTLGSRLLIAVQNSKHAYHAARQGYIYVESYKEAHVREAIQGLRNIFAGKGAKLVPLAEMVDAVNVPRPSKALLGALCGRGAIDRGLHASERDCESYPHSIAVITSHSRMPNQAAAYARVLSVCGVAQSAAAIRQAKALALADCCQG